MKSIILKRIVLIILVLLVLMPSTALAHSGRTDSSGGHRDNHNASGLGPYHYHHGKPAHLHPNGICPYANNNYNSTTKTSNSGQSSSTLFWVIVLGILGLYIIYKIYIYYSDKKSSSNQKVLVTQPIQRTTQQTMIFCPKCGSRMTLRKGRYGLFYGCTRYHFHYKYNANKVLT